jgi:hypothetical protein
LAQHQESPTGYRINRELRRVDRQAAVFTGIRIERDADRLDRRRQVWAEAATR